MELRIGQLITAPFLPAPAEVKKKARHFGEKFWLYIVTMAGTSQPVLHRIQNPAAHFRLDEDIFATGFIIPEDKWRERTD